MKGIDCHCHIFNIVSVGLRAILQQIQDTSGMIKAEPPGRMLKTSLAGSIFKKLKKLAELIKLFSGDNEKILGMLDKQYNGDYLLFPLMFDGDFLLDTATDEEIGELQNTVALIRQHLDDQKPKGMMQKARAFVDPNSLSEKDLTRISGLLDQIDLQLGAAGETGKVMLKAGNRRDGFTIQYESMVAIKNNPVYRDKVFPFLGVDPRRENIHDYLPEVGKGKNFAGIKVYPPNGFSPADPVLSDGEDSVFGYCCKNRIPVISHNSYGGFATPSMNVDIRGMILLPGESLPVSHIGPYTFTKKLTDGYPAMVRERARVLNHPRIWRVILEKHKGLILVLAHFGESSDPSLPDEWRNEIVMMMQKYPTLYTDISCISNEANLVKIKKIFDENPSISGRILYGSDYFLDMFFNDSFKDYHKRITDKFGDNAFHQISVVNPQKYMQSWYLPG
jgi:predicted TIM-barrel fold metal-dependent hydrolase